MNPFLDLIKVLCGVSRSTFAHRFRVTVGMGPIEYLQRWRMALAKDDLIQGKRSVGEIALAIGFQSSSAFSTAFSRAMGCSPKQFATSKLESAPASHRAASATSKGSPARRAARRNAGG
ncbi:MAG TPA: helix-turn-helix transcriptional regulator [Chthoniobacterales bacterium]|jgi:AraC-like DNA-binding protein|nr:helix-turn-helix transcriptional regulator [Chthoniobacterales bacterium]